MTAQVVFPSSSWRSFGNQPIIPSATDEDGVIGYQARVVIPPYIAPNAMASFPSIMKQFSSTSRASTRYGPRSSPKFSAA